MQQQCTTNISCSVKQEPSPYQIQCLNGYSSSFKNPPRDGNHQSDIQVAKDAFQLIQQRKNLESWLLLRKKNEKISKQNTTLSGQNQFQTFFKKDKEKDNNHKKLQDSRNTNITFGDTTHRVNFLKESQFQTEIQPKSTTPTQQTTLLFTKLSLPYQQPQPQQHNQPSSSSSQEQQQTQKLTKELLFKQNQQQYQQQANKIGPPQEINQFQNNIIPVNDININYSANNYQVENRIIAGQLCSSQQTNKQQEQPSNIKYSDPASISFANFLEKTEMYQKRKEENAIKEKDKANRKLESSLKEKPKISKLSRQIVEINQNISSQYPRNNNVHDRLYFSKSQQLPDILLKNLFYAVMDLNKENTFHPLILKRSKSIKRTEKVNELLYQDAKRRMKKYKQQHKSSSRTKSILNQSWFKYVIPKSDKILYHKFLREMQLIICSLNIKEQEKTACLKLDIASLFEIMIKLGFVKCQINTAASKSAILNSEIKLLFIAWTLLGGADEQSSIKLENLIYFCLIILNLDEMLLNSKNEGTTYAEKGSNPSSLCIYPKKCLEISEKIQQKKRESFKTQISSEDTQQSTNTELNASLMKACMNLNLNVQVGILNEQSLWCVSQEEKKRIRHVFEAFIFNRLSYDDFKSQKQSQNNQYTFHPMISNKSRSLAESHRDKSIKNAVEIAENSNQEIPQYLLDSNFNDKVEYHHDFQILQKKKLQTTLEQKRKTLEDIEISLCSFSPSINKIQKNNLTLECNNSKKQSISKAIKKTDELFQLSKNTKNTLTNITITSSHNNNQAVSTQLFELKKLHNDMEFQKQKEKCTFHPEINQYTFKPCQDGFIPKNAGKSIERLRRAWRYKEVLHQLKQTGSNNVHKKTLAKIVSSNVSQNTMTFMEYQNNRQSNDNNDVKNQQNEEQRNKPWRYLSQEKEEGQDKKNQQQLQIRSSLSQQPQIQNQKEQQLQRQYFEMQQSLGYYKDQSNFNNATCISEQGYYYEENNHRSYLEKSERNDRRNAQEHCQTEKLDQETEIKLQVLLEKLITGLLSRIDEEDNVSDLEYID